MFEDVVLYQTDWDINGLKLRLDNKKAFQVPLKKITKGSNKFWFCTVNLKDTLSSSLTFVVNDLSGKVYLYNSNDFLFA